MLKKISFSILLFLFLLEIGTRISMVVLFDASFFKPSKIIEKYYPILKGVNNYKYDDSKKNVLILGGSVVYNDTILIEEEANTILNMPSTTYDAHFCAMDKLMNKEEYNVLSLAMSAHNSLDSWYKYQYCKRNKIQFDYIVVYHGINDQRTNNIWENRFDEDYRHVEFYDDLYTIQHHPEINYTTIPFIFDWLRLSYKKKKQGLKRYISRDIFIGLLTGKPEEYVKEGKDIKTAKTFRRNYEQIIQLANKSKEKVLLTTYAWNQPDDYSFEKFLAKELPYYKEQLFPTELYGMPENIKTGLIKHNEIIVDLSKKYPELPFVDFNALIPKTSKYFNDVCHLTDAGCIIMADKFEQSLSVIID